jgi:hypothetical protein
MGFEVMGIWQDGMDGTDINSVHRANNGNFSVTAGDNGLVYLFNHPVVIDEAPHRAFRGHSSHVANVRFLYDDNYVISAGMSFNTNTRQQSSCVLYGAYGRVLVAQVGRTAP